MKILTRNTRPVVHVWKKYTLYSVRVYFVCVVCLCVVVLA